MKRFLLLVIVLVSVLSYAQTDSTDLTLFTSPPTLENELDSLIFGNGGYEDYELEFTITDTVNFGSLHIELSGTNNQVLFKKTFTHAELLTDNLIDSNWLFSINFGKFESVQFYKVALIKSNYAGVFDPSISKSY